MESTTYLTEFITFSTIACLANGIPEALPTAGAKQVLGMIGSAFPGSQHVIRTLRRVLAQG